MCCTLIKIPLGAHTTHTKKVMSSGMQTTHKKKMGAKNVTFKVITKIVKGFV